MTSYEIPLVAGNQTFTVSLGEIEYRMRLVYRDAIDGGWVLDISDEEGAAILLGLPLVTGADLLAQHRHLGIGGGGALWCFTTGGTDAVPTFDNLGGLSHLAWTPDA